MKKLLLVAFVAAFAFCTTSCKKDTLKDTLWKCETTEVFDMEGIGITLNINSTITFSTEAEGEIYLHLIANVAGFGELLNEESTDKMTYTYADGAGTITIAAESADDTDDVINFTVDGDKLTIVEDIEGTPITMIYTKQ